MSVSGDIWEVATQRQFSSTVQTGYDARPASRSMGTRVLSWG